MSLTRRQMLLSTGAASLLPGSLSAAPPSRTPKYLITIMANGGWDVTFSVDPKPRVEGGPVDGPWVDESNNPLDEEELRVIHGIPVQCNDFRRPSVTAFFESYGSRACVVNGIWTGSIVHLPCRIRMRTGTLDANRPDFGTIVGAVKGRTVDLPLGSIDFSGLSYIGDLAATTGRIGYASQLKSLLDPASVFPGPRGASYTLPLFSPDEEQKAAIEAHLASRLQAMREKSEGKPRNQHLFDDMIESGIRRERILGKAETITEPLSLGEPPSLDLQAELAIDLLLGGVCHAVSLGDVAPIWDTHDGNATQHSRYESLFGTVNRLMAGLDAAGIASETLVIVMSEMTRTPKLNFRSGKDHWAHSSQIWIGAGVEGGRTVGATDETVESVHVDLTTGEPFDGGELNRYNNTVAGILAHMGVDPEEFLPGVVPFRGPSAGAAG